ncbi:WPP domain-associated protein [Sesamum indicum]|uniref:WPP domain-associated protein n=1 Tax=Sesamum indicum TaxID=4182 RepID=A0A6I9TMB1_SESIN|nr:WPP domain-associated protein [Sesamum indicum]
MEDLFGQIECRTKSDSIVMRILRSAMDEAHEKLQSDDGPIEFLHERSTFYELAAILVEGGLSIVEEETDIPESSSDKILADLKDIRHWLQGRIQDMKHLIVEKDRELTERLENELKLRRALELKDMELVYLHGKLEPGRTKNDDIHYFPMINQGVQGGPSEGDIFRLKTSVDQQLCNMKRKLEDEKERLTTERRTRKSRVSSPNLSFEFLDLERNGSPVFTEDVNPKSEFARPDKNILIRWMSSDIDILKETVDLAFGRMKIAEVLLLEKEWRWTVEKDVELILVKGFISNLQGSFDVELRKKVGLLNNNWFDLINEIRVLCHELKDFFARNDVHEKVKGPSVPGSLKRTSSEPLLDIVYMDNLIEEDTEVERSHHVAKMIKNHELIIRKQRQEWNWLTREVLQREGTSSCTKRDEDKNRLVRRIQDAITRLDNLTRRKGKFADQTGVSCRKCIQKKTAIPKSNLKRANRSPTSVESLEEDIGKVKEERDGLCFQITVIEDTYQLLFRGMVRDISTFLHAEKTEKLMRSRSGRLSLGNCPYDRHINSTEERDGTVAELEGSSSSQMLLNFVESTVREDLYVVFFRETVEQWKKNFVQESIGSLLKEEIYMVLFREMSEAWKSEKDACAFESLIREDIYEFVVSEAVKDSCVRLTESESLNQLDFQERTPRSRRLDADQEGTPRSRRLDADLEGTPRSRRLDADSFQEGTPRSRTDGEESLIQKLDSLLKCLEAEEDLMLQANSEIKEHSVNNSLVILNCEEMDERDAIEWLITDDESTFGSVSEKLERALQQLYTSKELLVELEQSLDVPDDSSIEHEETRSFLQQEDGQLSPSAPSDTVLAIVMQFQLAVGNVEHMLHENLENKCLRLDVLKRQVDTLTEPVALIRTRKFLYKKAFISRCHNLKLAETEVDLLGDQVESLLCLLETIYTELSRNAAVFSSYFQVYDILKLIKRELHNGRSCL